jgi:hypothetical protein
MHLFTIMNEGAENGREGGGKAGRQFACRLNWAADGSDRRIDAYRGINARRV